MTLYQDEKAFRDAAAAEGGKAAKRKARKWYALSAAGVLVAGGGAAFAAMTITGDGSASAQAYQEQKLTISNARFSGPLFPGGKIDLLMTVGNPNPFPVKITTIAVKSGANPSVTCAAGEEQYLSGPLGTQAASVTIPTGDQATVPANNGGTAVVIHEAIHLSNTATKGCAVTAPFTISGLSVTAAPAGQG